MHEVATGQRRPADPTEAPAVHHRTDRSAPVRAAIRDAASTLFAQRGYSGTGVRDIAEAAGVNPALVIRHFVSKERLFTETIDLPPVAGGALDAPLDQLGVAVIRSIVETDPAVLALFAVNMRACDHADVMTRLRHGRFQELARGLAARLEGPDAELRGRLGMAVVIGMLTTSALLEDEVLGMTEADKAVAHYGAALQAVLTGDNA